MKIRLLVINSATFNGKALHYGHPDQLLPTKLQVAMKNEWGHYTDWEDVDVVFESASDENS